MLGIEIIKRFLQDRIDEMNGYVDDDSNGYDDCERHDCVIASDTYQDVLDFMNGKDFIYADDVRHARWIEASTKSKVGKKCSICGARIKYSEAFNGNHLYCHKCGARMDYKSEI